MSASPLWQLTGNVAAIACGPLAGRLDLSDLKRGWHDLAWRGQSCAAFEVLRASVAPDCQLAESYVRGADLVASYTQSGEYAIAPHCYWRTNHFRDADAVSVEMILSLQTSLLESKPATVIRSFARDVRLFHSPQFDAGAFREQDCPMEFGAAGTTHLVVLRHEALGVSYAQLVHPSDLDALQLRMQHDGRVGAMAVLMQTPQLEKGVIRRARICGWFLPVEHDFAVAVELAKRFLDEPLPLTA